MASLNSNSKHHYFECLHYQSGICTHILCAEQVSISGANFYTTVCFSSMMHNCISTKSLNFVSPLFVWKKYGNILNSVDIDPGK